MTTTNARDTTSCPRCNNRWTGLKTAHCTACHETFTTITAFDKHRTGDHANDTRHCIDPSTAGLINARRPYPCWGWPGTTNPHNADLSHETPAPAL